MMIQYTIFWTSLVEGRAGRSTVLRTVNIPAPGPGRPKEHQPPQTDDEEPRKNVKRQYRQNKALTDYKHRPAWETCHIVARPQGAKKRQPGHTRHHKCGRWSRPITSS